MICGGLQRKAGIRTTCSWESRLLFSDDVGSFSWRSPEHAWFQTVGSLLMAANPAPIGVSSCQSHPINGGGFLLISPSQL